MSDYTHLFFISTLTINNTDVLFEVSLLCLVSDAVTKPSSLFSCALRSRVLTSVLLVTVIVSDCFLTMTLLFVCIVMIIINKLNPESVIPYISIGEVTWDLTLTCPGGVWTFSWADTTWWGLWSSTSALLTLRLCPEPSPLLSLHSWLHGHTQSADDTTVMGYQQCVQGWSVGVSFPPSRTGQACREGPQDGDQGPKSPPPYCLCCYILVRGTVASRPDLQAQEHWPSTDCSLVFCSCIKINRTRYHIAHKIIKCPSQT